MNFDVIIIGGGPGGYVCAIRCAQLGMKVALVEANKVGGTCLCVGCIPTKALLTVAEIRRAVGIADQFGIHATYDRTDFVAVTAHAKRVVETLQKGVMSLMEKNNIDVISGFARFISKNSVEVNGKEITANNIVIATGALPRMLPGAPRSYWTSKDAMFAEECPKSIVIIGSGAIGIEFASFYNDMGAEVTVVELQKRILIQEDDDIAGAAKRELEKRGIKFILGASATEMKEKEMTLSNGQKLQFDKCLVAVGVVPNTSDLALEACGLKTETGRIQVNQYMGTSVSGIYAIGDVTLPPFLAHKASKEGIVCAERIAGMDTTPIKYNTIPACTYSHPQISSIGLRECDIGDRRVRIGKSYFRGNGKALASGDSCGFIKVIVDDISGEILGCHMIGNSVVELLPIISVAMQAELTDLDIVNTVFPHPTLSECLHDAFLDACGRS